MNYIKVAVLALLSLLTGCALVCKTETLENNNDGTSVLHTQVTLFGLSGSKVTSPGLPGMLLPVYASEKNIITPKKNNSSTISQDKTLPELNDTNNN